MCFCWKQAVHDELCMNRGWGFPQTVRQSCLCRITSMAEGMALLWQGATEGSWDHRNRFHFGNPLIQTQRQTNKKALPPQARRKVGSNYLLGSFSCNGLLGSLWNSNWMLPILKDRKKWWIFRKENQMSEKMLRGGIGTEKPWNRIGYQIPFVGSFQK